MPKKEIYQSAEKFYYNKENFLNYREVGNGSVSVFFLHGFGASNQTWDDIIPYVSKSQKYKFILIDLIGAGFSSETESKDFSMQANANAISRFIKEKKINDYVLVGHSFGGGVATQVTLDSNLNQINAPIALILIDTAAYQTGIPFFVKNMQNPIIANFLLDTLPPEFMAKYTLNRIYFDTNKVTDDKVQRYAYFMHSSKNKNYLMSSARQIVPKNYEKLISLYKTITVPTLILWGKQDKSLSIKGGERLYREIPNAKFVIIDKSGHNPHEEQPQATAEEINQFLNSISVY